MPIRANFWRFLGILTPWNCGIVVLTPKGMQYFQKHAFWDITRQNRSSGLTPSCADEQTKKHIPLIFHPFVGVTPPKRLICHLGYSSGVPNVITHATFCSIRLRGFSAAAPRKMSFAILFRANLTTVLRYRADCDLAVLCLVNGQSVVSILCILTWTLSTGSGQSIT